MHIPSLSLPRKALAAAALLAVLAPTAQAALFEDD